MNDHSCTHYEKRVVDIFFPDGNVCCAMCPLLDSDILKRKFCRRTGEYIANDEGIGYCCPLKTEEENDGEYELV